MMIQQIAAVSLALLLTGCASQSEVDALKKEVESMKAERAQQRELLEKAVENAQVELDICKGRAAGDFDESWKANSSPVKGEPGVRTGNRDLLNHLNEEQHRADAECQRDYENSLQNRSSREGLLTGFDCTVGVRRIRNEDSLNLQSSVKNPNDVR
jgi:outer membrane murein-binding lipoprotein Lpp